MRNIVDWSVRLAGDSTILEALESGYRGPDAEVSKDDDQFYLRASTFLQYRDSLDVTNAAANELRRLCGLLKIHSNYSGEVWPYSAVWTDDKGNYGGVLASFLIDGTIVFPDKPPDDVELLLDVDCLGTPDRHEELRLTFEEVNDLLVEELAKHPELMHEVHPRRFEELVAELFNRMGYEVELTPRVRDGGRDILAIQKDGVGTTLTLVECKRYSPSRKVGVELVRALYGTVETERASRGVIATTSSFTRGAKRLQKTIEYRLSLRDFTDLAQWCRKCQR